MAVEAWSWLRRQAADPEGQVLLSLGGILALTAGWVCLWAVPTEVIGRGVMIVPGGAKVIDARAGGQILEIPVSVGEAVRRGQPRSGSICRHWSRSCGVRSAIWRS